MKHETAIIDKPCKIGKGTQIWHFTHIRENVEIGKNCMLGQNVYIDSGVKIGNNVRIQNNVSVYKLVTIEDDVFLGPSCVFTNDLHPRAFLRDRINNLTPTLVKKGATIGANATILCGITIGEYAFIAAGAVVTKNIPNFAMVRSVGGKVVGSVDLKGYRKKW